MSRHSRFRLRAAPPLEVAYEWGLDALPRDRLAVLKRLLIVVDDLAAEQWLCIGREATAHRENASDQRFARARLDHLITAEHLAFLSWFLYDAVDGAAESILLTARVRDRQTYAAVHAARDALYCALMAAAVRDRLTAADYDALSASCRASIAT